MEEKLSVKAMQICFESGSIRNLKTQLYDFNDCLLRTDTLHSEERKQIHISIFLRNFYLRIVEQENDSSELFSYFWNEGQSKEGSEWLSEEYSNFVFRIQITVQQKAEHKQNSQEVKPDGINAGSMAKEGLDLLRERVFRNLQAQQFFKVEQPTYRCNFVRKKNHKNLTALLIKNSSNILRTLNQNIKSSSMLKSFSKIKITEETVDEASVEMQQPPSEKKKVNSAMEQQKKWSIEEQADCEKRDQKKSEKRSERGEKNEELPKQIFMKQRESCCRPVQLIKKSLFVHRLKKKTYERVLEKETKVDLKNQKETLEILKTYIQDWQIQPKPQLKRIRMQRSKLKIRINMI